jgi:ribosomal 50S subunit-recycling heat shock protein
MKKQGLKKPSVRGLKTVCSHVVKATGLKVDGTLKKGFKYIKGGKIVKIEVPSKAKKVIVKKPVAKKPAKKKAVAKKTTVKTKK